MKLKKIKFEITILELFLNTRCKNKHVSSMHVISQSRRQFKVQKWLMSKKKEKRPKKRKIAKKTVEVMKQFNFCLDFVRAMVDRYCLPFEPVKSVFCFLFFLLLSRPARAGWNELPEYKYLSQKHVCCIC